MQSSKSNGLVSADNDPVSFWQLLEKVTELSGPGNGVSFVQKENNNALSHLSYASLHARAKADAVALQDAVSGAGRQFFVLYFRTQEENIRWFWAVTAAGFIPSPASQFVNDARQRVGQIKHINNLLERPIVLTNQELLNTFSEIPDVHVQDVNTLRHTSSEGIFTAPSIPDDDLAALMLTSGSTGNAKAVYLHHQQALNSCKGKIAHLGTNNSDIFLNWIGLDHVANLVEIHLHALFLGASQIHVLADNLLADPLLFLHLIHTQRVTCTFAPNFFLDILLTVILNEDPELKNPRGLDLSSLRMLVSGGEANVLSTMRKTTQVFQAYGVQQEFLIPAFGLTESCGGVTYGFRCPSYDFSRGYEFTSIGKAIPGGSVRVTNATGQPAATLEVGDLELSGSVVFSSYYNNPSATKDAFTDDGWFKTGDRAFIDENGVLCMTGRSKDTININGVKYFSSDIESVIEQEHLPGLAPSFTAVFPHRPAGARTEEFCVVYQPTSHGLSGQGRTETSDEISRLASAIVNCKPFSILPLASTEFHKSALGKLSRAKIRAAFEDGKYSKAENENATLIHQYRRISRQPPQDTNEEIILQVISQIVGLHADEVSVTSNIFHLGFTSLNFFSFAQQLQPQLPHAGQITLTDILREPSVRGIAGVLHKSQQDPNDAYDPVVPLQPKGSKTPLWIVHPASGNVLAFISLVRYINDRPVFGLRASGVRPGERFFASLPAMAATYYNAIKRTQPNGPYAIAGYSLGSSIAYETAKLLLANGDKVPFVGVLDSPPHIASLVGTLTWSACLVMVSFFLELIPERYSNEVIPKLWNEPAETALDFILEHASSDRLQQLQLDRAGLTQVADTAHSFGQAARHYEPTGKVPSMDVFVVDPLLSVTDGGRQAWMDEYLVFWKEFVGSPPCFHQCEGSHADMLNLKYVRSFQRTLKGVLEARLAQQ